MNLLLEIGCEELPASAIQIATEFLPKKLREELEASRLSFEAVEAFGTPRRLLLLASGLSEKQTDLDLEVLGPKTQIAYDAQGNLTPAGLGFLKSRGLKPSDAYVKKSDKGDVLAAKVHESGKPAHAVLSELLPKLISQIPFAKTMRWEASKTRFSRPVRWILCLLDTQVVEFEFAGVKSSNQTCGHRFLSPSFETVTQANYFSFLEQHQVVFDREKRKALILEGAQRLAQSVGGHLHEDPALLDLVANLVEYPWPILGTFEKEYLEIPQEILICEMREHQKYFSICDSAGQLMPYFVVVAGSKPVNAERLAAGNARVLRARFEDGAFYYREDLKKKLEEFIVTPPESLMAWVPVLSPPFEKGGQGGFDALNRAAYLCKADLNSGVVGQFPELQGTMGGIYALKSGESPEVARAISEHYWPKFATDQIPSTRMGAILSLADRLATLHARPLPKGSADPYGLRRAAIGLVRIILDYKAQLDLKSLITHPEVLEFVMMRARGVFLEKHPVLVVDATQAAARYDLCAWQARILALEAFDYTGVSAVFKRVNNLVSKAENISKPDWGLLKEPSEQALLTAIKAVHINEHHGHMLAQLAGLKPTLDKFFEDIMVMVEDTELRNARLALLAEVGRKAAHVADFSKLMT